MAGLALADAMMLLWHDFSIEADRNGGPVDAKSEGSDVPRFIALTGLWAREIYFSARSRAILLHKHYII